jgi:hypothetical protein
MGRHAPSEKNPVDLRFTELLRVRCPPALPAAIERGANKNLMTASEYVRRSVVDRLKADGISLGLEG